MERLGDFLDYCLSNGFGGLALLALSTGVLLVVVLAVLVGAQKAAGAFARGWREAGPSSARDRTDAESQ